MTIETPEKDVGAAPQFGQGATPDTSINREHTTTPETEREILVDLTARIEKDRRAIAVSLAEIYGQSPEASISCHLTLRDLRLLGQEVGRLAYAPSAEVRS